MNALGNLVCHSLRGKHKVEEQRTQQNGVLCLELCVFRVARVIYFGRSGWNFIRRRGGRPAGGRCAVAPNGTEPLGLPFETRISTAGAPLSQMKGQIVRVSLFIPRLAPNQRKGL